MGIDTTHHLLLTPQPQPQPQPQELAVRKRQLAVGSWQWELMPEFIVIMVTVI